MSATIAARGTVIQPSLEGKSPLISTSIYSRQAEAGTIELHGPQDTSAAETLLSTVCEATADSTTTSICIDLSMAERIDTAAWQVLLALHRDETRPVTMRSDNSDLVKSAHSIGIDSF